MSIKKSDYIIEKGFQFIYDNPEIIKKIFRDKSYNDEPKLYSYVVYFKDKFDNKDSNNSLAVGVSFNRNKALLKVLGETVERYSLGLNNNDNFLYSSYKKLAEKGKLALSPQKVCLLNTDKKKLSEEKFHWVEGKSLTLNKNILIPGQLVYIPYLYENSELPLRFPSSSGAAAGFSRDDAIYRGICEAIERDAFMIAYLNKVSSPIIDLSDIQDKEIKDILDSLKRYRLEVTIVDLTTDLGIPVFAAIILDKTGVGPAVSVGLKAGFSLKGVIIGAIEEALMVRSGTRDQYAYNGLGPKTRHIHTIEKRALFWFPVSSIKYLDFWLINKNSKKIDLRREENNNLKEILTVFNKKNIDVMYVEIADDSIKKYGFEVVKVIIPKLQPLYLDEKARYLTSERLYSAPVAMGFQKKSKTKNTLNKIPHPFL